MYSPTTETCSFWLLSHYDNIFFTLISLHNNQLTSLPKGVFSQLTLLQAFLSLLVFKTVLFHISPNLNSNSLTHLDMGNSTPTLLFVSASFCVSLTVFLLSSKQLPRLFSSGQLCCRKQQNCHVFVCFSFLVPFFSK